MKNVALIGIAFGIVLMAIGFFIDRKPKDPYGNGGVILGLPGLALIFGGLCMLGMRALEVLWRMM